MSPFEPGSRPVNGAVMGGGPVVRVGDRLSVFDSEGTAVLMTTAKEQAIRDKFQMSATRYYQVLNALIDDPAALAHDPMLIKRLRRMRSSRQRARTARRLGDA